MSRYGKSGIAMLLALGALAFGANVASALRSFSVSQTTLSLASTELSFVEEGIFTIVCHVTINKTIASAFAKSARTVGGITDFRANLCSEGATVTPLGLGWAVAYSSFSGSLPNITSIHFRIERIQLLIRTGINACLVEGNGTMSWGFGGSDEDRDTGTTIRTLSGICPTTIAVGGSFTILTPVRITLV